ncbi:redox-sensing transcriptional repressor Rex [Nakamurella sp. YIM 132087]|uniref:Redox-sensing transcriptional repressor Rex n=1 Tax=Nakamurella alba TaxID=2665158 RepID=A0A7K1FK35_9ACTN|nr:redox-sensing transcriptional repressor Rex [Nakamurella alba]MTD14505.1 redox-sensing transcriptional repressor Rex [Nakamurella alba]
MTGQEIGGTAGRDLPEATVGRLAGYLRALTAPGTAASGVISSSTLAELAGVNAALLRKDLSFLGSHGTRGVGYDIAGLADEIRRALGTHLASPVALVGIGHLGRALARYAGFGGRGLEIAALFDASPEVIGTRVGDLEVHDIADVVPVCRDRAITIGVVATPEGTAQQVTDALVRAGVRSVLNFAPEVVVVPPEVQLRRVDLALELQILAFHETRRSSGAVGG